MGKLIFFVCLILLAGFVFSASVPMACPEGQYVNDGGECTDYSGDSFLGNFPYTYYCWGNFCGMYLYDSVWSHLPIYFNSSEQKYLLIDSQDAFCPISSLNLSTLPNYSPVCGSDGVTYSTLAVAQQLGVTVAHSGECTVSDSGVCNPNDYTPVCGSDGVTYLNQCLLNKASDALPQKAVGQTCHNVLQQNVGYYFCDLWGYWFGGYVWDSTANACYKNECSPTYGPSVIVAYYGKCEDGSLGGTCSASDNGGTDSYYCLDSSCTNQTSCELSSNIKSCGSTWTPPICVYEHAQCSYKIWDSNVYINTYSSKDYQKTTPSVSGTFPLINYNNGDRFTWYDWLNSLPSSYPALLQPWCDTGTLGFWTNPWHSALCYGWTSNSYRIMDVTCTIPPCTQRQGYCGDSTCTNQTSCESPKAKNCGSTWVQSKTSASNCTDKASCENKNLACDSTWINGCVFAGHDLFTGNSYFMPQLANQSICQGEGKCTGLFTGCGANWNEAGCEDSKCTVEDTCSKGKGCNSVWNDWSYCDDWRCWDQSSCEAPSGGCGSYWQSDAICSGTPNSNCSQYNNGRCDGPWDTSSTCSSSLTPYCSGTQADSCGAYTPEICGDQTNCTWDFGSNKCVITNNSCSDFDESTCGVITGCYWMSSQDICDGRNSCVWNLSNSTCDGLTCSSIQNEGPCNDHSSDGCSWTSPESLCTSAFTSTGSYLCNWDGSSCTDAPCENFNYMGQSGCEGVNGCTSSGSCYDTSCTDQTSCESFGCGSKWHPQNCEDPTCTTYETCTQSPCNSIWHDYTGCSDSSSICDNPDTCEAPFTGCGLGSGACADPKCMNNYSACIAKPASCNGVWNYNSDSCVDKPYAPVCGSDGVTYYNSCNLEKSQVNNSSGVYMLHYGNCKAPVKVGVDFTCPDRTNGYSVEELSYGLGGPFYCGNYLFEQTLNVDSSPSSTYGLCGSTPNTCIDGNSITMSPINNDWFYHYKNVSSGWEGTVQGYLLYDYDGTSPSEHDYYFFNYWVDLSNPLDGSYNYWVCSSNANCGIETVCAKQKDPVNGVCGRTAGTCFPGTPADITEDSFAQMAYWTCNGLYGGGNSNCSASTNPDLIGKNSILDAKVLKAGNDFNVIFTCAIEDPTAVLSVKSGDEVIYTSSGGITCPTGAGKVLVQGKDFNKGILQFALSISEPCSECSKSVFVNNDLTTGQSIPDNNLVSVLLVLLSVSVIIIFSKRQRQK